MSKKTFFQRTKSIVKKLNNVSFATFDEIKSFIEKEYLAGSWEEDEGALKYSKRTFQRDKLEIAKVWGIQIEFNKKEKAYFINKDTVFASNNQRMFETYETLTALQIAEEMRGVIFFESRQAANMNYFEDIIASIKKRTLLKIGYQKFNQAKEQTVITAPYGLKEYQQRWYIIAKTNNKLRIYALDRITKLERSAQRFEWDSDFDIDALYKDSFGIFIAENDEVQDIQLLVKKNIIPYFKSLPLHNNQYFGKEDKQGAILYLSLKITDELVNTLLSFGSNIKVLAPLSLQKNIVRKLKENIAQYNA